MSTYFFFVLLAVVAFGLCWFAVWLLWYRDGWRSLMFAMIIWCVAGVVLWHGLKGV